MSRGAAIVTGAPRRIGRALALCAADCGYDVLVHHRASPDDAAALVSDLQAKGVTARAFAADLADPDAPQAIMAETAGKLGPATLLINNASLFEIDSLGEIGVEQWDAHMAVNLRAPVMLTQAFANALPKDREGLVVNLLDQRVWRPTPLFFSYAVAKSALWTATRMSAQALAPRIRVNGIGPGPTLASTHQSDAEFEAEARATPLGEPVRPEDIAGALRYLIGAPRVTGQMIAVDAGQHLAWRTPDIDAT